MDYNCLGMGRLMWGFCCGCYLDRLNPHVFPMSETGSSIYLCVLLYTFFGFLSDVGSALIGGIHRNYTIPERCIYIHTHILIHNCKTALNARLAFTLTR